MKYYGNYIETESLKMEKINWNNYPNLTIDTWNIIFSYLNNSDKCAVFLSCKLFSVLIHKELPDIYIDSFQIDENLYKYIGVSGDLINKALYNYGRSKLEIKMKAHLETVNELGSEIFRARINSVIDIKDLDKFNKLFDILGINGVYSITNHDKNTSRMRRLLARVWFRSKGIDVLFLVWPFGFKWWNFNRSYDSVKCYSYLIKCDKIWKRIYIKTVTISSKNNIFNLLNNYNTSIIYNSYPKSVKIWSNTLIINYIKHHKDIIYYCYENHYNGGDLNRNYCKFESIYKILGFTGCDECRNYLLRLTTGMVELFKLYEPNIYEKEYILPGKDRFYIYNEAVYINDILVN